MRPHRALSRLKKPPIGVPDGRPHTEIRLKPYQLTSALLLDGQHAAGHLGTGLETGHGETDIFFL